MTITTPAILAMKTHDLQSDESHAQRLPRLQPSAASIPQSSGSDSIAPLWRCRPPDLRLTTRSPKLITVICRISSIKATDMPREVLGVRLRQYQLLSIRNGLQGFLKRTKIGDDTTYNLELKLPSISEHFHLPINPVALDINHDAAAHSKIHQAPLKPKKSKISWTEEEDIKLLQMWNEGRS
jgi:hypothetical protein